MASRTASNEMPVGLRVVADPHRWRLLRELARSDRRVHELTSLTGQPQNLVSYHLRELREAGLVSSRRSSFDGRDTYYRIDLARCGEVFRTAGASLDPALRLEIASPTVLGPGTHTPRVLFLCTGNSARSQMAEALLEHLSAGAIIAFSAGSQPRPLAQEAVRVMAKRGIDIRGRDAKHMDTFAGSHFDRVITLCDRVREVCPEFPGAGEAIHWSIPDPSAPTGTGEDPSLAFERVAADLETRIRYLIAHLSIEQGERNDV